MTTTEMNLNAVSSVACLQYLQTVDQQKMAAVKASVASELASGMRAVVNSGNGPKVGGAAPSSEVGDSPYTPTEIENDIDVLGDLSQIDLLLRNGIGMDDPRIQGFLADIKARQGQCSSDIQGIINQVSANGGFTSPTAFEANWEGPSGAQGAILGGNILGAIFQGATTMSPLDTVNLTSLYIDFTVSSSVFQMDPTFWYTVGPTSSLGNFANAAPYAMFAYFASTNDMQGMANYENWLNTVVGPLNKNPVDQGLADFAWHFQYYENAYSQAGGNWNTFIANVNKDPNRPDGWTLPNISPAAVLEDMGEQWVSYLEQI